MSSITNKGILNIESEMTRITAKIRALQVEIETYVEWRRVLNERLHQAVEEINHREAELEAAIRKQNEKRAREHFRRPKKQELDT